MPRARCSAPEGWRSSPVQYTDISGPTAVVKDDGGVIAVTVELRGEPEHPRGAGLDAEAASLALIDVDGHRPAVVNLFHGTS